MIPRYAATVTSKIAHLDDLVDAALRDFSEALEQLGCSSPSDTVDATQP